VSVISMFVLLFFSLNEIRVETRFPKRKSG
jgi:hypothetical protein